MTSSHARIIRNYRRWARKSQWIWYVTTRGGLSVPARVAKTLFNSWVSDLQSQEGEENFSWLRVMKANRLGANPDCRVLVGGLRNRMRYWESRFAALGGNATIARFDPSSDETDRMLDDVRDLDLLEIDCFFPQERSEVPTASSGLTRVRIDQIGEDVSPGDLKKLFKVYGQSSETIVYSDSREAYGIVTLKDRAAEDAIDDLDGSVWRGQTIEVSESKR
jgi:hypothetical protein